MSIELKLDASALKELIGNDEDIKLRIVNGVLNTYAKQHIKSIVNSGVGEEIARKVEEQIDGEIQTQVGKLSYSGYEKKITLSMGYKKLLKEEVQREVSGIVRPIIDEFIVKLDEEYIQSRVDRLISNRFRKLLDKGLEDEMSKKVSKAIEAMRSL